MADNTTEYALPTIELVGGATMTIKFNVFDESSGEAQILTGDTANFAVADYSNRNTVLINKAMSIVRDSTGTYDNVLSVTLAAGDTSTLDGKYIYQIQIKDSANHYELPQQGLMYISKNIYPGFISNT